MSSHHSLPRKYHRGLAALLAALASVGPFSIDAYLPSMPEIGRVLGTDLLTVQQTLTAYMLPFAIMSLWHGAISDALGRRRVILWGTALFALASVGCALASSINMLLFFRALQGTTAGAGVVVGRAIVRDHFHGPEAQRVMSQVSLTFALAPALAPVIGGWLEVWFGWRAVFVFLALFGLACWLLCRTRLPESLPVEKRQPINPAFLLRSYRHVLTSRRFLGLSLAITLTFSGFFIYVTSAPMFLMRHLHISATGFLWLFGPTSAGMIVGAWMSGRMADRWSSRRTLVWSFAIMAVATAGQIGFHLLHRPELPWSIVPLFFYVVGMSLSFPTLTLLALDVFPAQRGMASSCQAFIQTTGTTLNATLVPFVWGSVFSLAVTQAVLLVLAAAALALYRWGGASGIIESGD